MGRLQASDHDVCQRRLFSCFEEDNSEPVGRGTKTTPNNSGLLEWMIKSIGRKSKTRGRIQVSY